MNKLVSAAIICFSVFSLNQVFAEDSGQTEEFSGKSWSFKMEQNGEEPIKVETERKAYNSDGILMHEKRKGIIDEDGVYHEISSNAPIAQNSNISEQQNRVRAIDSDQMMKRPEKSKWDSIRGFFGGKNRQIDGQRSSETEGKFFPKFGKHRKHFYQEGMNPNERQMFGEKRCFARPQDRFASKYNHEGRPFPPRGFHGEVPPMMEGQERNFPPKRIAPKYPRFQEDSSDRQSSYRENNPRIEKKCPINRGMPPHFGHHEEYRGREEINNRNKGFPRTHDFFEDFDSLFDSGFEDIEKEFFR